MTATVHLRSWDKPPLTANRVRGIPQARAREVAKAKDEAIWWVRQAKLTRISEPVIATLHYRLPDRRRRDPDGWAPTLKVVLDALVAEAILRDDSTAYVPEVRLKSHPPTHGDGELWLTLEEVWRD